MMIKKLINKFKRKRGVKYYYSPFEIVPNVKINNMSIVDVRAKSFIPKPECMTVREFIDLNKEPITRNITDKLVKENLIKFDYSEGTVIGTLKVAFKSEVEE